MHMDMQKLGSAITYARRYGLQSLCGIFAEVDDDGAMAKPISSPNNRNNLPPQRSGFSLRSMVDLAHPF